MIPLRDDRSEADPVHARARALLRATSPLEDSAARKARVRVALMAPSGPRWFASKGRVVAALVAFGLCTAASAMLGGALSSEELPVPPQRPLEVQTVPPPVPSFEPAPAIIPVVKSPRRERPPKPRPPEATAIVEEVAPVEQPSAPATSPEEEGAALIVNAIRSLRADVNPKRANSLLEEYRLRFPEGPLLEDSFALSIEALYILEDARTSAVAREYLNRFPQGRFKDQAANAILRFGH
jgi:hypothetical protein